MIETEANIHTPKIDIYRVILRPLWTLVNWVPWENANEADLWTNTITHEVPLVATIVTDQLAVPRVELLFSNAFIYI